MLDALGERYGKLPSEVFRHGDGLDMWVFDVAVSYHNRELERKNTSESTNALTDSQGFSVMNQYQEAYNARQNNH